MSCRFRGNGRPLRRALTRPLQFSDAALEFGHFAAKIGEPGEIGQLLEVRFEGTGGCAPDGFARADDFGCEDAGARTEDSTAFDAGFVADAGLAANDRVVLDNDTSREAGLRRDDHMPADTAVVADMHHIVELSAFANGSGAH